MFGMCTFSSVPRVIRAVGFSFVDEWRRRSFIPPFLPFFPPRRERSAVLCVMRDERATFDESSSELSAAQGTSQALGY